jgi:[histone H3]-dimethyl-L-lysine9 demethylase
MSRFCNEELSKAIEEMEALQEQVRSVHIGANGKSTEESTSIDSNHHTASTIDIPECSEPAFIPPNLSETTSSTPTHELRRIPDGDLTSAMFDKIWSRGEPFVVTSVLHKFSLRWSPEYFMEKYGKEGCLIIECQSDTNKRVTVEQFFGKFGNYDGRKESWKLKVCVDCDSVLDDDV